MRANEQTVIGRIACIFSCIATASAVLVWSLSSIPSSAQQNDTTTKLDADLAVQLGPNSHFRPSGAVLNIRIENVGQIPLPGASLSVGLAVGERLLSLEDLDGQAVISRRDAFGDFQFRDVRLIKELPLTRLLDIGRISPNEFVGIRVSIYWPEEIKVLLGDLDIQRILVSISTDIAGIVAEKELEADLRNNTFVGDLNRFYSGNGNGDHLPRLLPWPPPAASARLVLNKGSFTAELDAQGKGRNLGAAGGILENALRADGHRRIGYLGVPGNGFALLTGLEQIDENAVALPEPARWSADIMVQPSTASTPGAWLRDLINAMLFAPEGHFRVFVFIVTDVAITEDPEIEIVPEILRDWAVQSIDALPSPLRALPYGEDHKVTVLVYEFVKVSNEAPAKLADALSGQTHLRPTRLARFLQE